MSNVSIKKLNSDTLLCSAGKGEVTNKACLACARSFQQTCGYDHALVQIMLSEHERTGIHVTDITGCLRKAWYEKTQTQPEYLHMRAYLLLGNAVHKHLEDNSEAGEAEKTIEAMGLNGTMDLYKDGVILDYKSTRWLNPERLPYGSHAQQVNVYAEMMRSLGYPVKRLFVQYIDLSGPTRCKTCKRIFEPDNTGFLSCPRCHREYSGSHLGAELIEIDIYPREETQNYINTRRDALLKSIECCVAPEKEQSFLCEGYCPFNEICEP